MRTLLVFALTLVACGPAEPETPTLFIALDRDVKDFRTWTRYDLETTVAGEHASEVRHVYVNRLPPAGATTFPVGTIVIKTLDGPDGAESPEIHGMVKRAADFNPDGAKGWEFLGLGVTPNGATVIGWRGAHPPKDGEYGAGNGSQASGDCNACHRSELNDAVLSPAPRLARD